MIDQEIAPPSMAKVLAIACETFAD